MRWTRRWLELWRPGGRLPSSSELDTLIQRRMYWFTVWFMVAMAPVYGLLTVMRGNPGTSWLILGMVFGGLALNVVWTQLRREYGRGLAWLLSVTFCVVLYATSSYPSVNAPGFWWLTVLPFAAILSGRTLLGVIMGLAVVAYTVIAYGLQPAALTDTNLRSLRLHVTVALSTVYACAFLALATLWRRQLQQALERAHHEATAAAAAKARFLANMSHEIRTPLNGVIGAAELLRSGKASDVQRAQLASLQEQSAKALLALINDVLDWSKLEAGRVALASEPVYLRGLVFESNELFAVAAFDKGIELTSSCNPDVPRRFVGDATRIRQIVNNLVSNAVKFTHQGGVHVHLALDGVDPSERADTQPRRVRIEVADSGIGIAPEQLARLFTPFEQADASITRKYGGTGLGLSISAELARLMGGRIEVSSTRGSGSTFTLVLPLTAEDTQPGAQAPRTRQDVMLSSASPGLIRHVRSLLHELQVEPAVQRGVPVDRELQGLRLLLIDAPLLDTLPDPGAWMARWAERGLRIAVMAPLNADTMPAALPSGLVLYKPVRRAALAALLQTEAGTAQAAAAAAPAAAAAAAHVLLCEDNPVNQIIVQAMLAEMGMRCTTAGNGVEALACLDAEGFDIVLMDLQMPELDGLAATRRWRAAEAERGGARVPIVAMTANTEGQEGAACRAAGMDGFLAKPFGMAALRQCLAQHTARRSVA